MSYYHEILADKAEGVLILEDFLSLKERISIVSLKGTMKFSEKPAILFSEERRKNARARRYRMNEAKWRTEKCF